MNLYPDPVLSAVNDYAITGSAIENTGGQIEVNEAGPGDTIRLQGDTEAALFEAIAASGVYYVSLYADNYESGTLECQLGGGGYFDLGIDSGGWSDPVPVAAGTSRALGFVLRGMDSAKFTILPQNGDGIRITTDA